MKARLFGKDNPNYKHGLGQVKTNRTYRIWSGIKTRCLNSNNHAYKYYGGRGITICEKWISFLGFFEDMGECPEGFSIERIDVNGNYNKENCKWIPQNEQARNRRYCKSIGYQQ